MSIASEATQLVVTDHLTVTTVTAQLKQLSAQIHQLKDDVFRVDLTAVARCDSAGLALLLELKRIARKHHKTLTITGWPEPMVSLAEFCGVTNLIGLNRDEK